MFLSVPLVSLDCLCYPISLSETQSNIVHLTSVVNWPSTEAIHP